MTTKITLLRKSYFRKGVILTMASKMAAVALDVLEISHFVVVELSFWCLHHGFEGQGIHSYQLDCNLVNR